MKHQIHIMKIGFSTLALFMSSLAQCLETASKDKFQLMEILCEGPYWPRNGLYLDGSVFEALIHMISMYSYILPQLI